MSDSTAKDNKVVIYSTNWCAFCKTEKQWLDSLNVEYIEKNIETDKAAEQELLQKLNGNFQGVPVTDIAGDVILGFDRPKLQAALEKNKLVTA
ncbi:NrdH-redoxin [Candidatus Saccharibacteria bacterium]|nr:NrdH-redoxin [Candidatus Saccharibacteria bacterium]